MKKAGSSERRRVYHLQVGGGRKEKEQERGCLEKAPLLAERKEKGGKDRDWKRRK